MDKPEYMKACDPFSDILDIAEKDLPNGASWNVWTTADNIPTMFVMMSATGQTVAHALPLSLDDITGKCTIMSSNLHMISKHHDTALAAMLCANDMFRAGLLSQDMASISTMIIMCQLETALDEMFMGIEISPDASKAIRILNVAIAVVTCRKRTWPETMYSMGKALIGSYRDEIARFLTAIRQDDGPDWESAKEPGYNIGIERAKLIGLVAAHLNSN